MMFQKGQQVRKAMIKLLINWLLVHRLLKLHCNLKESKSLREAHLQVIIIFAYLSLAIGLVMLSVGILVEVGLITPATPNYRPIIGSLYLILIGALIIQSVHLFFRINKG